MIPAPLRPLILSLSGTTLTAEEAALYAAARPAGVILFSRNVEAPDQVARLIADVRQATSEHDLPVLVDQEGGRVQRFGPPHWPARPSMANRLAAEGSHPEEACYRAGLDLADDLLQVGATVDCMPLADLVLPGADPIIGDRGLGSDPGVVGHLADRLAQGLWDAGVVPVIKHLPGHGRATVDSHVSLPIVDTPWATLSATDFAAFKPLARWPLGMTAHVVYSAIDPDAPATLSATVIREVIRGEIGFQGVLMGDDIGMGALSGDVVERAQRSLEAGCDLVLHCNGDLAEMTALARAVGEAPDSQRLRAALRPPSALPVPTGPIGT